MGSPVVWSVGTDRGVNMYIGSNSCKEEEEDEGSDLQRMKREREKVKPSYTYSSCRVQSWLYFQPKRIDPPFNFHSFSLLIPLIQCFLCYHYCTLKFRFKFTVCVKHSRWGNIVGFYFFKLFSLHLLIWNKKDIFEGKLRNVHNIFYSRQQTNLKNTTE